MPEVILDWRTAETKGKEINNWLAEHCSSRDDWHIRRGWVGYEDLGGWEYTVYFKDDRVATEFMLRWT